MTGHTTIPRNRRVLSAHGAYGYPDFSIYFNTYWDTTEPEDGEYSVTDMQSTDEYPPYTVHISSLYSSVLFEAGSGKVYVSHAGGKLQVIFCAVPLSGSNGGTSFNITASGMLTATLAANKKTQLSFLEAVLLTGIILPVIATS